MALHFFFSFVILMSYRRLIVPLIRQCIYGTQKLTGTVFQWCSCCFPLVRIHQYLLRTSKYDFSSSLFPNLFISQFSRSKSWHLFVPVQHCNNLDVIIENFTIFALLNNVGLVFHDNYLICLLLFLNIIGHSRIIFSSFSFLEHYAFFFEEKEKGEENQKEYPTSSDQVNSKFWTDKMFCLLE